MLIPIYRSIATSPKWDATLSKVTPLITSVTILSVFHENWLGPIYTSGWGEAPGESSVLILNTKTQQKDLAYGLQPAPFHP